MINTVVDLSHHNGQVDFQRAKANGIQGVIYKATQGETNQDATYIARRDKAKKAGLMWGAYHFGTVKDVKKQAANFLNVVKPTNKDLLVLDFEDNTTGTTMSLNQAREFIKIIYKETGRYPGLYSGALLKAELGNQEDPLLKNCWLWISHYTPKPSPVIVRNWKTWTMWQYTDGALGGIPREVDGIGRCDRNRFNGDEEGLKRLWGY